MSYSNSKANGDPTTARNLWPSLHRLVVFPFVAAALLPADSGRADPLDETYGRTFHLSFLGVKLTEAAELRTSMLSQTPGNAMPKNVKVGWSFAPGPFRDTHGPLYDFAANPFGRGAQNTEEFLAEGRKLGLPVGWHLNVMPWGDSSDQTLPILHNELEKYGGGIYLQVDSAGRIRNASKAQEPTANESTGSLGEQLEMQLTLSRYCTPVQDYFARNCRSVARQVEWYREQHADQVAFVSMASEYAQNRAANDTFCDYSVWSKQEFRDWLSGAGLYAGQPQFATLDALNSAYAGAPGFPYASFNDVEPPTYFSTANDPSGWWWWQWQAFRVAQVRNIVQRQIDLTREAGVPPDLIYGHQIPFNPSSSIAYDLKYASTWETTYCTGGGNGVTTYDWMAGWTGMFNTLYANDKNWGIFEYNPLDYDPAVNSDYLNRVWDAKGHVLCPYQWGNTSQTTYLIRGSAFETALQGFVSNKFASAYTGYAPYEGGPASRDVIWAMNEADDVESTTELTGSVTEGQFSGTATTDTPSLSLELNEASHFLHSDDYHAASFRLTLAQASPAGGRLVWHDEFGGQHVVTFSPQAGTRVYRINLAESAAWREKRITRVDLHPGAAAGSTFALDWFRFEARHAWLFNDPNEIYEPTGFTAGAAVSNGAFSGVTSSTNPFVYLSTDKRSSTQHADRALINASQHHRLRVDLEASANGTAEFRWWKRSSGPHQIQFPVSAGRQTYQVDLSASPDWSGEITRLGINPVNVSGATVTLRYVNLAPVLLPPSAANNQIIHNTTEPHFQWQQATEPDHAGITWDWELATDFEFTNKVATAYGILSSAYVHRQTPAPDGFHWWRVRSVDAADNRSPWMTPMPIFIRRWNGDYPEEIYLWRGSTTPVFTNGLVSAVSTNTDPYYHFNTAFRDTTQIGNGYRADLYPRFRARLRVAASNTNNNLQVYAFNDLTNTPAINSLRTVSFPANNQWGEITVDFTGHTNFHGWIRYARLDPSTQSNAVMELDYAELLPPAAPSNTAPVVTCDASVEAAMNTEEVIAPFRVVDGEEPASFLIISASSSNTNLVRNEDIVIEGAGANRTVRIRPLANRVGTAIITVQVQDGTAVSTAQFAVRITGTALQEWRQLYFGTAVSEGPAGDAVDADDDGWGNLWEFVAGTDPLNSTSHPVPQLAVQDYFTVAMDRQAQSSNVTLSAEVSFDLVDWYSGPAHVTVLEDTSLRWQVRDNVPAADGTRRFMRLKAMSP